MIILNVGYFHFPQSWPYIALFHPAPAGHKSKHTLALNIKLNAVILREVQKEKFNFELHQRALMRNATTPI